MFLEGQQLGRYRLLRFIGSGGKGEVYLATDPLHKQDVALKVFDTLMDTSTALPRLQEAVRLFQEETNAHARLDHPHLLPLLDAGQGETVLTQYTYVVMPFCQEGSLIRWLGQHHPSGLLAPQEVARLLHQLAAALHVLHERGLIHGNVKPSNILMRPSKETPAFPDVLLADAASGPPSTAPSHLPQPVSTTGQYEAPERRQGTALAASDQYSLAVVIYELLTGQHPFQQRQADGTRGHPQPPSTLTTHLSNEIDAVILRALAENPQDRFPSIVAFASAFERALPDADDLHATLVISPEEARRGCSRPITLPERRKMIVAVPPDVREGQTITLEGVRDPLAPHRSEVTLTITLTICPSYEGRAPTGPAPEKSLIRQLPPLRLGKRFLLVSLLLLFVAGSSGLLALRNTLAGRSSHVPPPLTSPARVLRATGTTTFATATAIAATANPYPPYRGRLTMSGTLRTANPFLPTTPICGFVGFAYDIKVEQGDYRTCSGGTSFTNFVVEVSMTILKGNCGGIMLRTDSASSKYYLFEICSSAQYGVFQYVGAQASDFKTLKVGRSSSIKRGVGQLNVLAVVASGSSFTLYVNRQVVEHLSEGSYTAGSIGFIADGSDFGGEVAATEVAYIEQKVWLI